MHDSSDSAPHVLYWQNAQLVPGPADALGVAMGHIGNLNRATSVVDLSLVHCSVCSLD